MTRKEFKIISLSASGQVVEFYDFMVFVLFTNIISSHFFVGSVYARDMYTFGIFALGYIARPLGGIIFGHYGDTVGRKKTFIATIFLISTATFCMGLIPNYKTIGLFAPAIFIFLRIIQGISLGGELPGAISFVYEYMQKHKKTFGTSFIFSAAHIGYLLAFLVVAILYSFFDHYQLTSYGWRIAFFLGGVLGFVICILRGKMSDTPVFEKLLENNQILRYPLTQLLSKNSRNCILGILIFIFPVYGSIFILALPNLLSSFLHYYSPEYILKVNIFAIIVLIICSIAFCYIIDRFKLNLYLFFTIMSFLIIVLIYPLFMMIQTQNHIWLIVAYTIFAITYGMIAVVYHILAKLFPSIVEYSGLGLTINTGAILGVGLVPLISTYIFANTTSLYTIAYALIIVLVLPTIAGLILLFRPPNQEKLQELDEEIKGIYSLDKKLEVESLTPEEDRLFKKKLDSFAENLIGSGIFFESSKIGTASSNAFIEDEINKLTIGDIHSLNYEQQQDLYQRCKYLLKTRASNPAEVIHKYQKLLENSTGNKYYTYFYTRLIIKEYIANGQNKQLTAKDINLVIEQHEKDIEYFKQYE